MDLLYDYSKFLSMYYADSTKETYLEQVKLFLEFLEGYKGKVNRIILYNLEKKDIYNYIAYISDKPKGTIKIKLSSVHNFISYLNKDLSEYLFEDIKLFDTIQKSPHFLSWREIDLLLNYYSGEKRDIIYLFLNLGIRLSEMANLNFSKINYEENYLTVIQKGNKQRKVYFNEETKQVLKKYTKLSYSRRQIQYFITYAMKKLGIKGSVHTLRHTFGTYMYKQTKDLLVVRDLLGHTSVEATKVYIHIDNEQLRKAYNSNPLANFKVGGGRDETNFNR